MCGVSPGNLCSEAMGITRATPFGRTVSTTLTSLGTTAPQSVSGTLPTGETVWSGLVKVTGDLTVPANGTLRLSAGTVVLLDGNATPGSSTGVDLIINGSLLSEGTATQPVTLTCSDNANRWGELLFNNTAAPSLLQHTLITRGGRSPGRGHTGKGPLIRLVGSQLTLEDCALGDSPAKAFYTSGTGSLTQSGFGTMVLSGTNTYTGATTVSAGTLLINGNNAGATGAISVASGATLGGSGSLGGALTLINVTTGRLEMNGPITGAQAVTIGQKEKYQASKLEEHQRDHALYVAYAPADNPRIVVAAVVEVVCLQITPLRPLGVLLQC